MKVSLCTVFAACACGLLAGMSPARAAGSRIQFAGAILEPTCSMSADSAAKMIAGTTSFPSETRWQSCAAGSARTMPSAAGTYHVAVARLSSMVPDRVLKYFDTYVKEGRADAVDPLLVTQTYE